MAGGAARRLEQLSKNLKDVDKVIVKTAGTAVTQALQKRVNADTGGDGRMSGFGKKAKRLNVDVKPVAGQATGVRITPARSQAGQWTILDQGAKPHDVIAKGAPIKGKGAKRARRQRDLNVAFGAKGAFAGVKPLRTPFGPRYRASNVRSPAKGTWSRAAQSGIDDAVKQIRDEFHRKVQG